MRVADVCSSTDNFLSPIPVSDWLIYCCGNLILIKEGNENDKDINFLMKNNKQNKKCLYMYTYSSILYSKLAPLT